MSRRPVFIGGFRSGTTLLINLLGMHPDIAPWFETKSLCETLRWQRVLKQPQLESLEAGYITPPEPAGFSREAVAARMRSQICSTFARISGIEASGKAAHEKYPLGYDCVRYTPKQADLALANWSRAVAVEHDYDTVCAATGELIRNLGEKQRQAFDRLLWINKTPEISRFAAELRDSLGTCWIIYMVRNGIDVVASARKLRWGDVETLAFNWKALLELTRESMQAYRDNYLELRYEDLLEDPAGVLDRVFTFCELRLLGGDIMAQFIRDFGKGAFDLSRIGQNRDLSPEELGSFNKVAGGLQGELGY